MEWKNEPLGEIAFMTSGGTPSKKCAEYYTNGLIPWVRSGELENRAIRDTEIKITQTGLENSSAKIFPKGTLLIALYGATIGKLAYLDIDACTNQAICGIFENPKVSLKYLYYYLFFYRPDLVKQGIGGAQPNISQAILKKLMVHYPIDKSEQDRIVSRIEELFSELDSGVETLKTVKAQLEVYRQAVLKEAFQKVQAISKVLPFDEILTNIESGKSFKCEERPPKSNEYGIIKVSAVTWGVYNEDESKTCPESLFLRCKQIRVGDFLFSRANTLELIGNCVVVDRVYKNLMLSDKILRFSFSEDIDPKYVMFFLRTPEGKKQIRSYSTGNQESMRNIGQDRIRKIRIPICSLPNQKKAVEEIEFRLAVCKEIEQTVDTALQQAKALRQSILKKAFEGKLLKYDGSY